MKLCPSFLELHFMQKCLRKMVNHRLLKTSANTAKEAVLPNTAIIAHLGNTRGKMKTYDDVIRELKSNFPKTKEYEAGLSFVSLIKHHLCDFGIMIANAVAESYLDDMHLYCDDWCQNPGACPPSCPLYKYIDVEVRK